MRGMTTIPLFHLTIVAGFFSFLILSLGAVQQGYSEGVASDGHE